MNKRYIQIDKSKQITTTNTIIKTTKNTNIKQQKHKQNNYINKTITRNKTTHTNTLKTKTKQQISNTHTHTKQIKTKLKQANIG